MFFLLICHCHQSRGDGSAAAPGCGWPEVGLVLLSAGAGLGPWDPVPKRGGILVVGRAGGASGTGMAGKARVLGVDHPARRGGGRGREGSRGPWRRCWLLSRVVVIAVRCSLAAGGEHGRVVVFFPCIDSGTSLRKMTT